MEWKTFEEWDKEGLNVIKGEKSILRCPITGKALFNNKQVYDRYENFRNEFLDW